MPTTKRKRRSCQGGQNAQNPRRPRQILFGGAQSPHSSDSVSFVTTVDWLSPHFSAAACRLAGSQETPMVWRHELSRTISRTSQSSGRVLFLHTEIHCKDDHYLSGQHRRTFRRLTNACNMRYSWPQSACSLGSSSHTNTFMSLQLHE